MVGRLEFCDNSSFVTVLHITDQIVFDEKFAKYTTCYNWSKFMKIWTPSFGICFPVSLLEVKGQLISEQICGVLNFPKVQWNIPKISTLASKMGQIKNIEAIFCTKW